MGRLISIVLALTATAVLFGAVHQQVPAWLEPEIEPVQASEARSRAQVALLEFEDAVETFLTRQKRLAQRAVLGLRIGGAAERVVSETRALVSTPVDVVVMRSSGEALASAGESMTLGDETRRALVLGQPHVVVEPDGRVATWWSADEAVVGIRSRANVPDRVGQASTRSVWRAGDVEIVAEGVVPPDAPVSVRVKRPGPVGGTELVAEAAPRPSSLVPYVQSGVVLLGAAVAALIFFATLLVPAPRRRAAASTSPVDSDPAADDASDAWTDLSAGAQTGPIVALPRVGRAAPDASEPAAVEAASLEPNEAGPSEPGRFDLSDEPSTQPGLPEIPPRASEPASDPARADDGSDDPDGPGFEPSPLRGSPFPTGSTPRSDPSGEPFELRSEPAPDFGADPFAPESGPASDPSGEPFELRSEPPPAFGADDPFALRSESLSDPADEPFALRSQPLSDLSGQPFDLRAEPGAALGSRARPFPDEARGGPAAFTEGEAPEPEPTPTELAVDGSAAAPAEGEPPRSRGFWPQDVPAPAAEKPARSGSPWGRADPFAAPEPVPAATPDEGSGAAAGEGEGEWRPVSLDLDAAEATPPPAAAPRESAGRLPAEAPTDPRLETAPAPKPTTGNVGFRTASELTEALREASRVAQETRAAAPTQRFDRPSPPAAAPRSESTSRQPPRRPAPVDTSRGEPPPRMPPASAPRPPEARPPEAGPAAPPTVGGAASGETPDLGTSDLIQPPEAPYDEAHYRAVFDAFCAARRQAGESVEGLHFEAFSKRLSGSEQTLRSQHVCRLVRFQVLIRDRKVTLRPQLIR